MFFFRYPMIGIGFWISDILELFTFAVVVFLKIKRSEDQSKEVKNSFKIVCVVTLFIVSTLGLVKMLYWNETVDEVLGKQISYLGGFFCVGIIMPGTLIARNQKMTDYLVEGAREKLYHIASCLAIYVPNDFQSR